MNRIFVDPGRCTGCRSCEIGCAVQHSKSKSLIGAIFEDPAPAPRLFVEQGEEQRMPVVCRHCEDAPCVNFCVTGCLYHDENGYVRRHKERCIGCWTCIMACPFGVVTRDANQHLAVKCDRCHKLDVPACVNACPTGALRLVDIDRLPHELRQRLVLTEETEAG